MFAQCETTSFVSIALVYKGKDGAHDLRDIGVFLVSRDGNRLDEELVSALCVKRRVLSHGLQQD